MRYYTQLSFNVANDHFKRVDDAFNYAVICRLTGDVGYRLSREAMKLIETWGTWFT